jgi:hypothetical protein
MGDHAQKDVITEKKNPTVLGISFLRSCCDRKADHLCCCIMTTLVLHMDIVSTNLCSLRTLTENETNSLIEEFLQQILFFSNWWHLQGFDKSHTLPRSCTMEALE